ncbi:NADH:ubiquinone oxidoreductase [Tulasnella sp. JGI-2019a]|nr:NADH:ubiquinone oxidoreductase [Tulasnella sp. JGI-2019a]
MNSFHSHTMYSSTPPSPSSSRGNTNGNSETDWRLKYLEANELLQETRAELDDFTRTSRELEEELERDLERTEKAQEELRMLVSKVEVERDDWKMKFVNMQHTHNTTTNSLQRELDATRQSLQLYKNQVRELEMGNDDLERNERQASSSLADVEQRYGRALEEKILLEHELQDKAALEETCQRLRDELRDVNLEVTVLKDQVSQLKTLPVRPHTIRRESTSSLSFLHTNGDDPLLQQEAPELTLDDLILPSGSSRPTSISQSLHSRLSQEIFNDERDRLPASPVSVASFNGSRPNSTLSREHERPNITTTPTQSSFLQRTLSPTSSASTRLPAPRTRKLAPSPQPSSPAAPRIPVPRIPVQRSRGVQMVSDMRARVRTLEQKIQLNMPRMRTTSTFTGGPPGRARASSRSGLASTVIGNVRTPKKMSAPPSSTVKDSWVLIADDGAADTTLRGTDSPESVPRLPVLANISPLSTGPLAQADFGRSTTTFARPSTQSTSGVLRSTSALGRPLPKLTAKANTSNGRAPVPPPTAFPGSMEKAAPTPLLASTSYNAVGRSHSRSTDFGPSTADAAPASQRSSTEERPTTPTFLAKAHVNPAVNDILRRSHTMSSPTKPKAHLTAGVMPRARKDSSHQSKVPPGSYITKDAGLTPGRAKVRNATIQDAPPPPVPILSAELLNGTGGGGGRGNNGNSLAKSRIGKPAFSAASLGQSRIGRPNVNLSPRKSADNGGGDTEDEDVTVRIIPGRVKSGTAGR